MKLDAALVNRWRRHHNKGCLVGFDNIPRCVSVNLSQVLGKPCMMANMFNEAKPAQMAAYFLGKADGAMPYLKLLKLLYLADREAMRATGDSISGDHFVSMPHGPVLSRTYELINHSTQSDTWDALMTTASGWRVKLRKPVARADLDELSDEDIDILNGIQRRFGAMSQWEIRDWTHEHCAEWEDPHGSSFPIRPGAMFRAVGCSASEANTRAARYNERRELDRVLSRYA
jgi:uncharacterized phage-associated protein